MNQFLLLSSSLDKTTNKKKKNSSQSIDQFLVLSGHLCEESLEIGLHRQVVRLQLQRRQRSPLSSHLMTGIQPPFDQQAHGLLRRAVALVRLAEAEDLVQPPHLLLAELQCVMQISQLRVLGRRGQGRPLEEGEAQRSLKV
jgi:hypothetical protein